MEFTKAIVSLVMFVYIGCATAELLSRSCVNIIRTEERVCEHQTLSLECPTGQTIEVVEASYGRSEGGSVCPNPNTADHSCHASNSLSVLQTRCDGRNSCSVAASNGVFGDPCVGTFKYLEVAYDCRD